VAHPYYPRALDGVLRRATKTFPAILVTGPRQTGKTTLLRTAWGKGRHFVSLEQPAVRARAEADPVAFLKENPPPLILDEVQYVPELLHHLKPSG
jgi:predicted AAA+ superfamily ATPase